MPVPFLGTPGMDSPALPVRFDAEAAALAVDLHEVRVGNLKLIVGVAREDFAVPRREGDGVLHLDAVEGEMRGLAVHPGDRADEPLHRVEEVGEPVLDCAAAALVTGVVVTPGSKAVGGMQVTPVSSPVSLQPGGV